MTAIQTEELSKDYLVGFWRPRPYRALDRLSLAISEGEVFGFLGPNGAGKSTTLKLLMGLVFPTRGSATISPIRVPPPVLEKGLRPSSAFRALSAFPRSGTRSFTACGSRTAV